MIPRKKTKSIRYFYIFYVTTLLSLFSTPLLANISQTWNRSNESNREAIDHRLWQTILTTYITQDPITRINLFRYSQVTPVSKQQLEQYLSNLQAIDPRNYRRSEQKAYWVNLYNALTVNLILNNYPVKRITKLGKGVFSFGPWDDEVAVVANNKLSLNHIEHNILRPIWKDPLIHYAVNCASYSCPNLSNTAFTADNIKQLLKQGAQSYINHPRGISIKGNTLLLSSIYKWYLDDFGGTETALIQHLASYAKPQLKHQLNQLNIPKTLIKYDYNWQLNEPK